jgi:peptide/nickel transport system permease protein
MKNHERRTQMGIKAFIAKRTIYSVILVLFVLTLNFIIFALMPGDPTIAFAATGKLTDDQIKQVIQMYGLTQDLGTRYVKYLSNMLTFQLGYSFFSQKPVQEDMMIRLPNTLLLVGLSSILSMVFGVILGVFAASRRGSTFDTASVFVSLTTYAFPSFWMGMIFLLVFHYWLGWFPGAGSMPREWGITPPNPLELIAGRITYLALPLIVLTLFQYGGYLLLTRACMLETLTEDYVVTARAKGVNERNVLFKHALKNASLPLITSAALSFGFLLTGAIITEQVFTYPGMGQWLWQAITQADYPVLQAVFYVIALCVIAANFIADLLYGVIDPRIRYG